MNSLRNRVQLIGNLGEDPEIKTLKSGRKLATFSMATNDFYTSKDGDKIKNTEWHNIVVWGKRADIVENYLTKGKEVMVAGKLTYRSYENKKGEKRFMTEIDVSELQLMQK